MIGRKDWPFNGRFLKSQSSTSADMFNESTRQKCHVTPGLCSKVSLPSSQLHIDPPPLRFHFKISTDPKYSVLLLTLKITFQEKGRQSVYWKRVRYLSHMLTINLLTGTLWCPCIRYCIDFWDDVFISLPRFLSSYLDLCRRLGQSVCWGPTSTLANPRKMKNETMLCIVLSVIYQYFFWLISRQIDGLTEPGLQV